MSVRGQEEPFEITVDTIGGSADAELLSSGFFNYIDIKHPGVGDPDYKLQIVNVGRGTPVWEARTQDGTNILTGDCVAHVTGVRIPLKGHAVRVKESTLAGLFEGIVSYEH